MRDLIRSLPFVFALAACGGGSGASPPPNHPVIEVDPVVVHKTPDDEVAHAFESARTLLLAEKYAEAKAAFLDVAAKAGDRPAAAPALYNAGIAEEALGERDAALGHYRETARRFPDDALAKPALLRVTRQLAYLERWAELDAAADAVLLRPDLTVLELVEGRGAKGLARVELDDVEGASKHVLGARDLVEQHRLGEAGRPPLELAQVSFALGELRRKKSEQILFEPMPPNFTDVLEARCQALLDAQAAYTEAMRSYDAHWSAMAGYRVGALYQTLHRDVMKIPTPKTADTTARKQLFEGAMRLRYRILLEKGLAMMDATLRLGDRTGEASPWIGRAREAKRSIELALEQEKLALAKLPYTEEQLRAGLDSLKTKK